MATLLYAVLDPEAGTLRFASAGHPPPLILTPGGEAVFAEGRPGSPLGTVTFPSYEESVVALEPGSVVLLYTDGLVERPTVPLSEGLDALAEAAAGHAAIRPSSAVRCRVRSWRAAPATTSRCSRSASSRCPPTGWSSRSPPSRARSRLFAGSSAAG